MAFPLTTVLAAAPGLISAAADVIRVIKQRKEDRPAQPVRVDEEKFRELETLIEKQAMLIEELALNNRDMTLAVRNNRILCLVSLLISLLALILAIAAN